MRKTIFCDSNFPGREIVLIFKDEQFCVPFSALTSPASHPPARRVAKTTTTQLNCKIPD